MDHCEASELVVDARFVICYAGCMCGRVCASLLALLLDDSTLVGRGDTVRALQRCLQRGGRGMMTSLWNAGVDSRNFPGLHQVVLAFGVILGVSTSLVGWYIKRLKT